MNQMSRTGQWKSGGPGSLVAICQGTNVEQDPHDIAALLAKVENGVE